MKNIDNLVFGDIVIADLPYTDNSKTKIRPVLILSRDRDDYLLMKISSIVEKKETHDLIINQDEENKLEGSSLFKIKKIGSYTKKILRRKIGHLSPEHKHKVKSALKTFIDGL